jgi:hypothetical protein
MTQGDVIVYQFIGFLNDILPVGFQDFQNVPGCPLSRAEQIIQLHFLANGWGCTPTGS